MTSLWHILADGSFARNPNWVNGKVFLHQYKWHKNMGFYLLLSCILLWMALHQMVCQHLAIAACVIWVLFHSRFSFLLFSILWIGCVGNSKSLWVDFLSSFLLQFIGYLLHLLSVVVLLKLQAMHVTSTGRLTPCVCHGPQRSYLASTFEYWFFGEAKVKHRVNIMFYSPHDSGMNFFALPQKHWDVGAKCKLCGHLQLQTFLAVESAWDNASVKLWRLLFQAAELEMQMFIRIQSENSLTLQMITHLYRCDFVKNSL